MLKVSIFAGGAELDLFGNENISISDTIQDTRDPASIFTSYSQTFSVPASKKNNIIFKHYYNNRLIPIEGPSGFDARYKLDAIIKIDGADWRYGTIKLNSIQMKRGRASSYNISFVGDGADLKDSLENDDLSSLVWLDRFNHDYSLANAKSGLAQGLGLNGSSVMAEYNGTTVTERSVLYPLISHTKRYVYDSSFTAGSTFKLYNSGATAGTEGLDYQQLKPALKLIHIIEAIEDRYGITFTRDFFGDVEFDELYMWMNRTKGFIEGVDDNTSWFYMEDITFDGGADDQVFDVVDGVYEAMTYELGFVDRDYELTFNVVMGGTGNYDIVIYNGITQEVLLQSESNTGTQNFVVTLDTKFFKNTRPEVKIVSAGTITTLDVTISGEKTVTGGTAPGTYTGGYTWAQVAPVSYVNIPSVIPKMNVIDFLKGLFRMFNLTHYKKSNGDIYVDTLDSFYALGSNLDITKYVDITESTVEVPIPYDFLSFQYTEPKTFLTKNRYEILNAVFGDAEYSLGTLFGGSKYEIETGFSHMMFENLEDLNDSSDSDILFGWGVDEDENATTDAPLIFYRRGAQTGTLDWDDEVEITTYQSVGNTNSTTAGGKTINFGEEIDEFTKTANANSLFITYYDNYVSEVYGAGARIVRYSSQLPPAFLLNYNLYDKLIISGVSHKINSINIDLLDGQATLELVTE